MPVSPNPAWARRRDVAVRAAVRAGLLDPGGDAAALAAFVDVRGVEETVAALHAAWPEHLDVRHTFAAKANSLVPVLRMLRGQGLGCEVASAGELALASAAGFAPEQLVFDSPAKTEAELRHALAAGVAVNVDNFQELARIDAIVRERARPGAPGERDEAGAPGEPGAAAERAPGEHALPPLGVRVNPQVGVGGIEAMSTAGAHSKFGVPLQDRDVRERLTAAYRERPWLGWIHVHVGSQGCPLKLIGAGVAAAVEFAERVNEAAGERRIVGVNIGGGLTVDFQGEGMPDFAGHARAVLEAAPALARGEFRIITEFGRSVMAKNGFLASRVEYAKEAAGRHVAITHLGAQVATRTVLAPKDWPLRVLAYDEAGEPSREPLREQDVAGPCCFAGDLVARARTLPLLRQNDIAVLADTGAYYFSTPFRYNSLPAPPVYAFELTADGDARFTLLRRAETMDDVIAGSGAASGDESGDESGDASGAASLAG